MPANGRDVEGYVCVRCASRGPTCCVLAEAGAENGPGAENICFPVSLNEQRRIHAGLVSRRAATSDGSPPLEELFALSPNSENFHAAMLALFPAERSLLKKLYPSGQEHRRMSLRPDGSCVCLARTGGCVLPAQARPWYCRLFPFWFIRGRLLVFTPENCLAVEYKSLPVILRAFSADEESLLALYRNLRLDWGLAAQG